MTWTRRAALALGLVAVARAPAQAAPRAERWPRWEAFDDSSSAQVDHLPWADFLNRFRTLGADGVARLRYAAVQPHDRAALDTYLEALQLVRPTSLRRPVQMAFWLNLYNALTVRVVLERYPVRSIRDIDISPGLFANGPWGAKLVAVEGEPLSLDDVEHRILRPIWRDPRIHYAVNCASLGCPDLRAEPYDPDRLDAQLDEQARGFVNHPRGVTFEGRELVVSSIYDWFVEDFGGDAAGVLAHLEEHAAPPLRSRLEQAMVIDRHRYDWNLNDAEP